jgi:succinate dehydrogenase/fumarate reductase-like Fe-S protein
MSHILHASKEPEVELGEPIQAEVFRFDPSVDAKPYMKTYTVPYTHRMSIFTLLREIYERQDNSLAFRNQQCGRGICGTCQYRIGVNGKVVKGCTIPLKPGDHIVIEPYNPKKVIRDLVVDF